MYPPKLAESLEEGIQNVLESLQRACPEQWSGRVKYEDNDGKVTRVHIHASVALDERAKKLVIDYVRTYLRASGLKVKAVTAHKHHCTVSVSNI